MRIPAKHIWVLEDDPSCQFIYEEILGLRYSLELFSRLAHLTKRLCPVEGESEDTARAKPDLLIADLRLPEVSFLAFLDTPERKLLAEIPFMVVSSVDDLDALRFCFQQGAADYLTKPFGKGELIVKIERILATGAPGTGDERLSVDLTSLRAAFRGRTSPALTTKELQILTILQKSPLQTASRDEIVSRVWGSFKVDPKSLDVHLFNLRKKLAVIGFEIQNDASGFHLRGA